ncbi:hypothetical protein HanXRQr2_Chr17g0789941 [Helianthus annuus]|uniref:Uncharacterized protein n=1 Tax=Helianthus annuus TaxID=4232 RepID=A0A9K3GSY8_HELAN|nr:hypothetical protein HanXRQr2_Chr17g0789941 [Helianthus annuus]
MVLLISLEEIRLVHFVVGLTDCASQCNGLAYLVTLRTQNFNRDKEMMEKEVGEHVKMITTKHKRTKWRLMIRSKIPKNRMPQMYNGEFSATTFVLKFLHRSPTFGVHF